MSVQCGHSKLWPTIIKVVFCPSGVGGNLVAVQASRLSTALHLSSTLGTAPQNSPRICPNPFTTFFGKGKCYHGYLRYGLVVLVWLPWIRVGCVGMVTMDIGWLC